MPSAARRARPKLVTTKAPFPSPRQARCNGLKRHLYPGYIQWAIDFDYADKLDAEARAFLSAFSEEHYKGWSLARETQIHSPEQLREANAAHARRRRGDDVLSFAEHRDPTPIHGTHGGGRIDSNPTDGSHSAQLKLAAGAYGMDAHELRGRNLEEEWVVRWLDRPRRVK